MKNIIAIVGESGTGKTHMANYLETKYGIKYLESYTDRPPRFPEERGHTFVTREEFTEIDEKDMIAYTEFGAFRYCATKKQIDGITSYVIDEPGLDMLITDHSEEFDITTVRVYRTVTDIPNHRLNRNLDTFKRTYDQFNFVIDNDSSLQKLEETIDDFVLKYDLLKGTNFYDVNRIDK